MKALLFSSIIASFLLFPLATVAEVYECSGSYTNVPCSELPTEAKPKKTESELEVEQRKIKSRKQGLLHDLRMQQIKAKREHKIEISIREAEEVCSDKSYGVKECRELVNGIEDRLAERVQASALAAETKRANDLKEKQLAGQTNTVVIQRPRERIYIDSPDYRYGDREKTETTAGFEFKTRTRNGSIGGGFSTTHSTRSRSPDL